MGYFKALKALATGKKVQRQPAPSIQQPTSDTSKSNSRLSSPSSNKLDLTAAAWTSASPRFSRSSSSSCSTSSSASSADFAPLPRRVVIDAPDTVTKTGHMAFDLADRLALASCDTIALHDSLIEPLRQLQHACQPSPTQGSTDPFPSTDVTSKTICRHQEVLLSSLLETGSMLAIVESSLRRVFAIGSSTLVRLDQEVKTAVALIRYLRHLEESIESTLLARTKTNNNHAVSVKVEDDYIPRICTAIEQVGMIRERIEILNRELVFRLKFARPPTNLWPIEH